MHWKSYLGFVILLGTSLANGGICNFNSGTSPGLPTATCAFPTCPSGIDCLPPAVDKSSAKLTYNEPLIQWHEACPDTGIQSVCWEVHIDFQVKLAATDVRGINYIGVNLAQEVSNQRTFKKYWGPVSEKDTSGRYTMTGTVVAYTPPGQQLLLSIYQLCARDGNNNEGCVFPIGH